MPSDTRETSCLLLRTDEHSLLLDAGTGIRRLVNGSTTAIGTERVDVLLSHFHLDHIIGLTYLPALGKATLHVWGPGQWLYGSPTADIIARILQPPFFSDNMWMRAIQVHEMKNGSNDINGVDVQLKEQRLHSDPSIAIRIGDALTYCTDTAFDPSNALFAEGSSILFHEAWAQESSNPYHSCQAEAVRVAEMAGVPNLVLIHLDGSQHLLDSQFPGTTTTNVAFGTDNMQMVLK